MPDDDVDDDVGALVAEVEVEEEEEEDTELEGGGLVVVGDKAETGGLGEVGGRPRGLVLVGRLFG